MGIIFVQQGIMLNKGKELLGMTSRPRRRVLRVSENYDDNHLWEDSAVYAGEKLRIHATKWQDPLVLDHWGITEDFNAFVTATGSYQRKRLKKQTKGTQGAHTVSQIQLDVAPTNVESQPTFITFALKHLP